MLTASSDKTARLWEADSGKLLTTYQHDGAVWSAAFSPNGQRVLTASEDKTARLWEADSGKLLAKASKAATNPPSLYFAEPWIRPLRPTSPSHRVGPMFWYPIVQDSHWSFAVFDVFRESDPVADSQRDLLSLEHTELPCLVEWQLLLDAVFSDDDSSLLSAKDFPLFAALKSLFWDSSANSSLGHPVKLNDLPWLISDCITLLGISQVQSLKPGDGMFRV